MQLSDMIFGQTYFFPRLKNQIHRFSVTSDFLLVASLEALVFQVGSKRLDLRVGELGAFNGSGGADNLNRRHLAQPIQPFWGERFEGFPLAFELIHLRNSYPIILDSHPLTSPKN